MAWLSPLLWPFLRVLALFSVAPLFSMRVLPMRARIALAFLIALCAQALLPQAPVLAVDSAQTLGVLAQQLAVALALGFALRLVFAALELAGEIMGLQMGLNFASFFDAAASAQISAVARFFNHMGLLLFVAMNGHLLVVLAVVKSFERFPVDGNWLQTTAQLRVHELGAALFSSALALALPLLALLLFVNFTLGVISRVAPQMNIYAVGFPLTLSVGLLALGATTLPMLEQPLLELLARVLERW